MRLGYNQEGAVTLMAVLIAGLISLTSASLVLLTSIGRTQNALSSTGSGQTFYNASACAEHALQHVYSDQNYVGTNSISLSFGDCNYSVFNLGGEARRIQAISSSNNATRRIEITISQLNPQISISSWQEIPNF